MVTMLGDITVAKLYERLPAEQTTKKKWVKILSYLLRDPVLRCSKSTYTSSGNPVAKELWRFTKRGSNQLGEKRRKS